jgi:hypothetical protein
MVRIIHFLFLSHNRYSYELLMEAVLNPIETVKEQQKPAGLSSCCSSFCVNLYQA